MSLVGFGALVGEVDEKKMAERFAQACVPYRFARWQQGQGVTNPSRRDVCVEPLGL